MLLTKEYQLLGQTVIGNTGSGNIYLRLYGRYIDQSIVDNTSLVQYKVVHYLPAPYTGITYWSSSAKLLGDVTGNYTAPTNKTFSQGETTLLEVSKTIEHTDDGSKTINVGGQFSDSYFAYPNTHTVTISNVECELPTIARKSSISCASPFNIGDYVTLNIDRKNNSFVHTIRYNFEDVGEKVIATNVTNSTYSWLTPSTMFTDGDMENKTSGTGYLTVETFSGDISLGISDKFYFTANVPNNPPDIEATIIDSNTNIVENYTGDNTILVSGLSNAQITANVTPKNNATLKSYKVTCGDSKSSTTYPTTTLNSITNGTFTITATDSRGFPKTEIFTSAFKNYFKPYATKIDIKRTEQTSKEIIANITGKWWNNNFGIRDNTLKYSYRTRESGGSWGEWSADTDLNISLNEFTISNVSVGAEFDTGKAYDVQFRLKDEVDYYNLNAETVTVSIPIVEVYDDEVAVFGNGYIENKAVVGTLESKNFFNKYANNYLYFSNLTIMDEYIRTSTNLTGAYYTHVSFKIDWEKLLGKTITLSGSWKSNGTTTGRIGLGFFGESSNAPVQWLTLVESATEGSINQTLIVPTTLPSTADRIELVLYSNSGGEANIGDYVDYYDVQIEEGSVATTPASYLTTIVESGKNDLGSWIKYSDGKMECSCIKNVGTVNSTQAWGNNFISNANIHLDNYPQTFIDEPVTTVSYSGNADGDLAGILVANKGTTTTPPVCRLLTATSKTLYNVYVSYTAKGYWK